MKYLLIALLFIVCSFKSPKTIGVMFFENCEPAIQTTMVTQIRNFYHCNVVLLKHHKLPATAYYRPRSRYRADSILEYLHRCKPARMNVLAFTNKDISCTKGKVHDWGVFGLGSLVDSVAVSSSFRAKGLDRNNKILNTALHEIGHTYGLRHCPNKKCLMADAEGHSSPYHALTPWMCDDCKHKLGLL